MIASRRVGGRPQDRQRDVARLSPLLLALVIGAIALTTPKNVTVSRLLPVAPALAASMWSVGATLGLGLGTTALVVLVEALYDDPSAWFTAAAGGAVTAAAAYTSHVRLARERTLRQVRSVADAAQTVVMRPLPDRIGPVHVQTMYLAAAEEARVGGDFYDIVDTPYGVRLVIGDVRGKGLSAVGVAGAVTSTFRDAAFEEPDLARVAHRLDAGMARYDALVPSADGDERFATAVLAQIPHDGARVDLLNCGHPPPVLAPRDGRVRFVEPPGASPPLNMRELLGGEYRIGGVTLGPGDRLLFYTDGVSETRDRAGRFFPLLDWLRAQAPRDPRALLDGLHRALRRYSGGGLDDDIAVLAVRRADGEEETAGGADVEVTPPRS
ncbi:PP2C family protein-serine/threonine phosphatase [Actinacidiphila sp. DG2A-62]|uniref:PP2C family protein-serine/threonine phosphatase n=1 Tax=Actinacidiphila sp. DG2A-62 TaxID=3108821 RepID=UPI002DB6AE92|nr:PP2C family protein-serine/threonine phosphatase [Actinacidiphila sp. DG2A-62]MEC3998259.1 PP2C family protein-serine/threonine phosphatase [Actinacidiphila sp. DG2A-62]